MPNEIPNPIRDGTPGSAPDAQSPDDVRMLNAIRSRARSSNAMGQQQADRDWLLDYIERASLAAAPASAAPTWCEHGIRDDANCSRCAAPASGLREALRALVERISHFEGREGSGSPCPAAMKHGARCNCGVGSVIERAERVLRSLDAGSERAK